MTNFTRYEEFLGKLQQIAAHFAPTVKRYNDAVVVWADPTAPGRRLSRSIGVTRLLANYYRPSIEEQTAIRTAKDPGKELGFAAFRHAIDAATFERKFRLLAETRYETYDDAMVATNQLNAAGIVALGLPELMLGSRLILAREFPEASAEWLHLTGSIDSVCYNRALGKLVLVELKSGFTSTNTKFHSMQTLHLKEKHCKQLCLYAEMLLAMAVEANVSLSGVDLQLVVVANNKSKHMLSIWEMQYDPQTFLCGTWATDRWHGLLDLGHIRFEVYDQLRAQQPACRVCGLTKPGEMLQTRTEPVWIFCQPCFEEHRCACGRVARIQNKKTGERLCSRDCPLLLLQQQPPREESPASVQ